MKKESFFKKYWLVMLCGLAIGAAAVILSAHGNPANMGFCVACFLRDIAGSLKLHQAGVVQYFRPEIVGIIAGACIMALIGKEFKPKAGSSPVIRFTLGAAVMIGALVFLGCPLRQLILTGEGNSDSAVTVLGMIAGAAAAHTLKTASSADGTGANGPVATIVCLVVILVISLTHLKEEQQ